MIKKNLALAIYLTAFVFSQFLLLYGAFSRIDENNLMDRYFSGYKMHFIAFFFTAMLLFLVLYEIKFGFPVLAAFVYSVFVAVAVEYMQKWLTNYRSFNSYDMLFGILGAACFLVIGEIFLHFSDYAKKFV